jgi:hypothetical protein
MSSCSRELSSSAFCSQPQTRFGGFFFCVELPMFSVCRLYRWACRKWGPRGMTVSAWLWARELEGGGCFWREFIDDTFLCFKDEEDHCMRCYQRETRKT